MFMASETHLIEWCMDALYPDPIYILMLGKLNHLYSVSPQRNTIYQNCLRAIIKMWVEVVRISQQLTQCIRQPKVNINPLLSKLWLKNLPMHINKGDLEQIISNFKL